MFLEYFIQAKEHLLKMGRNPILTMGRPLPEVEIIAADHKTDYPMPSELREFYLEMGDGFSFSPDRVEYFGSGWYPILLADHTVHNRGFFEQIEEEALGEIDSPSPRVDIALLREEANRRKKWIPFYGFIGGGDLLCLDTDGSVRFYEALYWRNHPNTWNFVLAGSLSEFIRNWSNFCFTNPGAEWASFCMDRSGAFTWDTSYFPSEVFRSMN